MFGSRGPNAGGNSRGPTVAAASLHLPDQTQPHLVHTHGQEITWQVLGQAYAAVGTKQRKRRTLNARERREAAETRKVGACPACKGSHKKCSHKLSRVPTEPSQYEDFLVDPSGGYESEHNRKVTLTSELAAYGETIEPSFKKALPRAGGKSSVAKVVVIRPKPDRQELGCLDETGTTTHVTAIQPGNYVQRAQAQQDPKSFVVSQKPRKKKQRTTPLDGQIPPFRLVPEHKSNPAMASPLRSTKRHADDRKPTAYYRDEAIVLGNLKEPERLGSSNTLPIWNKTTARTSKSPIGGRQPLQDTTNLRPKNCAEVSKSLVPSEDYSGSDCVSTHIYSTSMKSSQASGPGSIENTSAWIVKDTLPQIVEESPETSQYRPAEPSAILYAPIYAGYVNPIDLHLQPNEATYINGPSYFDSQYPVSLDIAGEESMTDLFHKVMVSGRDFLNEYEEDTVMNDESMSMGDTTTVVEDATDFQAHGSDLYLELYRRAAAKSGFLEIHSTDQAMADDQPMSPDFIPAWGQ